MAAADGWGLAAELTAALSRGRVVSRGPKATGALRAADLPEEWSPDSESSREVLRYLLESGVADPRIAVRLHGATDEWDPFPEFLDELRARRGPGGADPGLPVAADASRRRVRRLGDRHRRSSTRSASRRRPPSPRR